MILFILKTRGEGSGYYAGLNNCINFTVDMLTDHGIPAILESVIDGNGIDKLVDELKPSTVILEAIWCPPSKLEELARLHPKVEWVIRIHSEIPFLANEGLAISWLHQYTLIKNVRIAANSVRATRDLRSFGAFYLPNYYPIPPVDKVVRTPGLKIGCFGAIRPMKNQLIQAFAAIEYAESTCQHLDFYVNSSRTEQGGEQPLKNLRALFSRYPDCNLVEVPWLDRKEFLDVVSQMDLCLNVSLSETFNIVTADAVSQSIPVVVSPEISWASRWIQARPNHLPDILNKIRVALKYKFLTRFNLRGLRQYDQRSVDIWVNEFKEEM